MNELQKYGIQLYRNSDGRVFYVESGQFGQTPGFGEIKNPASLGVDVSSLPAFTSSVNPSGTSKTNYSDLSQLVQKYQVKEQAILKEQKYAQERDAFNSFIEQNKQGVVEMPKELAPTLNSGSYVIVNGVLTQKGSYEAQQAEAKIANDPNYVRVPIGSGFGYVPKDSPSAQQIANPALGNTAGVATLDGTVPQNGLQSGPTGQFGPSGATTVRRDAQDNFYVTQGGVERKIELPEFKSLGINADFVPRGSSVPLNQAKTGQQVSTGSGENTGTSFNPTQYGISQEQWTTLDPGTKAFVESVSKTMQSQFDAGQANVSLNAQLLNDAMRAAENDPDIKAKYGDALKLSQANLQQNLAYLGADYQQNLGFTQEKQARERQALQDEYAAKGAVYSGFNKAAQERMGKEHGGIIESSRRVLQGQLNEMGSKLEGLYGTQGLNQFGQVGAGGLAYTPAGGITGTVDPAKRADIRGKGLQEFEMVKLPA